MINTQPAAQTVEVLDETPVNVASIFFKKTFGTTNGYAIAKSKNSRGVLVIQISSNLLTFDLVNKNKDAISKGLTVKSVAQGLYLEGKFDSVRKLINACKNSQQKK